ncbi:MAG: hypothetical protein GC184_11600 [Rhizobiales bacterium]|nr:hypothetical protein [Hyphomicrobiales bacterium]
MMGSTLAIMAMAGVMAYFIYTGQVLPDDPVVYKATSTQTESYAAGQPTKLTIDVRIENYEDKPLELVSPTQCEIFEWFVTDPKGELVQSQTTPDSCAQMTAQQVLTKNQAISDSYTIELDPARVKPGEYRLFTRYWGMETNQALDIR